MKIKLLVLLLITVCLFSCKRELIEVTYPIISLNANTETEGSFFLGSGGFEGYQYYYLYIKKNGFIRFLKIRAIRCGIIFDKNPRVVLTVPKKKRCRRHYIYKAILYIPKGSIKQSFNASFNRRNK